MKKKLLVVLLACGITVGNTYGLEDPAPSSQINEVLITDLQNLITFIDHATDLDTVERYKLNRQVRQQLDEIIQWVPNLDPELILEAVEALKAQGDELEAELKPWDKHKGTIAVVSLAVNTAAVLVLGVGMVSYLITKGWKSHKGKKERRRNNKMTANYRDSTGFSFVGNSDAERKANGVLQRQGSNWNTRRSHNPSSRSFASHGSRKFQSRPHLTESLGLLGNSREAPQQNVDMKELKMKLNGYA